MPSPKSSSKSRARNSPRRPAKPRGSSWKTLLLLALLLIFAGIGSFAYWASQPIKFRESPIDVHVPAGSGLRAAVRLMHDAGAQINANLFVLLSRVTRTEAAIKAGSYELQHGLTPWSLLNRLASGKVSQAEIVFPEGWTFRQLRSRVDAHPDLGHDTAGLSDVELLRRIGAREAHPEGLFFPDTYLVAKRSSDVDLYARAYRTMHRHLEQTWAQRDPRSPLKTPYEALTLASIVEKETGKESDRQMVAAVFTNRLRLGMMLQTDPTVIYGLGERFDGNLRRRDLETDTPYNTYTRGGLTPTPIAMPSLASLQAATRPATSRALYFVARGDGSSEFSDNLDAHNRAVQRFQLRGGR